eukprot:s695_g10.t1
MEPFQVVRYQAGQFFQGHQDYLDAQEEQVCGGRVGTFFMYLNDVPEGDGASETHFEKWDLTITPRTLGARAAATPPQVLHPSEAGFLAWQFRRQKDTDMFLGNAAGRRKAWLFFGGTSITQPSSMAFSDASSADVRLGLLSPRAVLRREADRGTKDEDAWHQSLPVVEGEKWVVNRWLHPYDFLTPYFEGKLR